MPDTAVAGPLFRLPPSPAEDSSLPLLTLYEVSKILGSTLDLEHSLHDVLNVLASYMQMRRGVVTLKDAQRRLEVVAVSGMTLRNAVEGEARYPLAVAEEVVSTAMPMIVPSMAADPRFAAFAAEADGLDDEVQSMICVPIKGGVKPFGSLSIERHRDQGTRFKFEHDVRFLTMVATLIAQTVSLERRVVGDRDRLIEEKTRLEKALPKREKPLKGTILENVVGRSSAMMKISAQVRQIAPSRATVLLRGESGTGKELIAQAIHYLSPRSDKPFIKVNCAALPETLLESELFGHEKGAFTGATTERKGRFEMASGGTLFLDEIGEITVHFQAKLLRVLQEGEFERVGGGKTIKVDVRLVAATNKDLEDAVTRGEFRADLYYRINVVPIFLPALRERREDVPLLAQFFLTKFNEENGRSLRFSEGALTAMGGCNFPGNVRELENCVCRAATLAQDEVIQELGLSCHNDKCLSASLWQRRGSGRAIGGLAPVTEHNDPDTTSVAWEGDLRPAAPARAGIPPGRGYPGPGEGGDAPFSTPAPPSAAAPAAEDGEDESDAGQRERIVHAMEKAGWVQAKAARLLGMTPRQIGYALKKHDIPLKRM
ncbi:nif-specific transcriptional activator NifA [Rhodospirillum rubrum]|uniref:nif-specific transcriptional activator NifA n=1 Tax=Rhodospirillum rubrum TaxID=1085 RepID=UPI001907E823|nr:nif-specific transcriptional activator NifA [Rhodospirillum rubrum]MBK1664713.1 nif-specific transcriptional activator NifA [Rhodospirillum rubrum]MBK1676531.1 nif-specific transcriptional activator NifA [Rhodospirillum rubrum]